MQNENKKKRQKVQLIKIKSPHDFWVSVKDIQSSISKFSDLIDKEENNQLDVSPNQLNSLSIVGYQSPDSGVWYRAKITSTIRTFGDDEEYICFLIDKAETRLGPKERFKQISNQKLKNEPPIARRCTLYGIKPSEETKTIETQETTAKIDKNGSKIAKKYEWAPGATEYFINTCKTAMSSLSMIVESAELCKENEELSIYKIYLFLKLDESTQEKICINNLMINKRFAIKDLNVVSNPILKTESAIESIKKPIELIKTESPKTDIKPIYKNSLKNFSQNYYLEPNKDVLVDNFPANLTPINKYDQSLFHSIVIDYIKNHGTTQITDFQSYCLASILNHRHLFALTSQSSNSPKTYIYPLISMLLQYKEEFEDVNDSNRAFCKANNGPLLLIVCTSCKNAQYIYEIINEMIELIVKYKSLIRRSRGLYKYKSILKCLMLQGGGDESQYDVPLASGCDILISATPFVVLRAIGENKTNLEKLKCLVFDDLYNLVEKFPSQIRTLMSKYKNILELNDNQVIAQLIGFSYQWSPNIRKFLDKFFYDPILIGDNKLEMSFYGQTHHVIYECLNHTRKWSRLRALIDSIQITKNDFLNSDLFDSAKIKNIAIFVNERETGKSLVDELSTSNFSNIFHIHQYTHQAQIDRIVQKFNDFNQTSIQEMIESKNAKNLNLILVIQDSMTKYVNIDNVKAVVHFDMPRNKASLSERLWFMRRHFLMAKTVLLDENNFHDVNNNQIDNNESNFKMIKSSTFNDLCDRSILNDQNNNYETNDEFLSQHEFEINSSRTSKCKNEIVLDDSMRFCSIMLFDYTNEIRNNSYISSIFKYIKRMGYEEDQLPKEFVRLGNQQLEKKESKNKSLCPLIKAYGKCLETKKCEFRHKPDSNADKMGLLSKDLPIPFEGYIKFKISFVEDTNYFFINILQHQNLCRELVKVYDRELYDQFDFEMQNYYSNPDNIQFAHSFKIDELYAYKERTTSLYKRISIIKCAKRDNIMGYEVIVQAIDYGAKFSIQTQDLINLPEKFKQLPPQAVEVFLCNVCPTDRDLNWSTSSRVFMAERLDKNKEYVGKIQMAAGRTLWLDPINTFNHLKNLDMIVMNDCIRLELIGKKYAVKHLRHISEIRNLFTQNNVVVPKLQDENFLIKMESIELYSNFYGLKEDENVDNLIDSISYSYLDKCNVNEVQITAVDTPSKFFVQKEYSQDSLISLNDDFEKFLLKIKEIQEKSDTKEYNKNENENENNKIYLDYIKRIDLIRTKFNMKLFQNLKLESKPLFCFALLKKENWKPFRAQIVNLYQDETDLRLRVFFVDYGDYDIIKLNDVYPIDLKYLNWLPFQAIECTLENIKQTPTNLNSSLASSVFGRSPSDSYSSNKWPEESSDMLWQLTHYENDVYMILDAIVVNEISTINNSLKPRSYSVYLKRKNYPVYTDISHLMVKSNVARFTLQELEENMFKIKLEGIDETFRVEDEIDEEVREFLDDKRKLALAFFRSRSVNRQNLTLKSLLNKINTHYIVADQEKLQKSGLIEALGQTIFFLKNKQDLLDILEILRRALLLKKPEKNKIAFFNSNGVANIIYLLLDKDSPIKENQADLEYVFKFIYELTVESNFIQSEIINSDRYLKSFFNLTLNYKKNSTCLNDTIDFFANLINMDDNLVYSKKFGEYLKTKIFQQLAQENNEHLNNLVTSLNKKYEIFNEENEEKLKETDREDKEKLLRCAEYVASNFNDDNKNDLSNNKEYFYDDAYNSDSSGEEVMEEFTNELMSLMKQLAEMDPKNKQLAFLNHESLVKKNDFIYPNISWDQTKENVIIKVYLKRCKEWKIDYTPNSISFRATLNEKQYGFDLKLYSNIVGEKCKSETNADFVIITLEKQFQAIWIRLLSTLNKPKFIKSEYNNLKSSSSDDEKQESKLDNVPLYYGSSSESDESTDFEDTVYNDVKESKDIYWND